MELRVLRYFLAVCEEKNISKAANSLHISQPSLSRQLKNLEEELGVTLFYRGHQEITLTQEGYYLQEHAEEIISLANKTQQNLKHSKIISGELYIGAGESIAIKRVMDIVNNIVKNYPQVKIHVFNGNSSMIEGKIERGILDFGITMGQYDTTQNFNSLTLPENNSLRALAGCFLRIGIPLFYPCDEQGGRDVPEVGYVLEEVHVGRRDAEYLDIPVPPTIW